MSLDDDEEMEVQIIDSALELLQAIYRSPAMKLSVRMRAAMAALPFESPKLAVIATNSMSGDRFAELLERGIARSRAPMEVKQIELKPNPSEPGDE
jgi:hypothetical protein